MKKIFLSILIASFLITGCTQYDNPQPVFEEYEQEEEIGVKNKVLVVLVDGLVGSQLRNYMPAHMSKMLEKSKFSYEAKADINTGDAPSLVTLLSGYPSSVHHVTTDSYLPDIDNSHPHGEISYSPSLISRIEDRDPKKNTVVIMRNAALTGIMLGDADLSKVEDSDQAVATEGVNYLKNNNPDFLLLQFSGAQDAGKQGGFVTSNGAYKSALDNIDAHIKTLQEALETRSSYQNENWLIVICSAHGGTSSGDFGGTSSDEMNTFTMYYNKDFVKNELRTDPMESFFANGYFPGTYTQYDGKTVRTMVNMGVRAQTPAGAASNMFNADAAKEITYEFKMKLRNDNVFWEGFPSAGGYVHWYDYFLGKDLSDGNNAGWHVRGQGSGMQLRVQNGSGTEVLDFARGTDGEWNHFAIVFKEAGVRTIASVYVNGNIVVSKEIAYAITAFRNTEPLTIGFNTSDTRMAFPHADMADVRVWKKALTDNEVKQVACTKWITNTNPLNSQLIAYYTTFEGNIWKDIAGKGAPNMTLSGTPETRISANYNPCGNGPTEVFVQSVDLMPQVFYWLDVPTTDTWKLAGTVFLNNFENEFKK